MASVSTVYIWSENLIKDLAFKERLGLKADLIEELVAVVQHAIEKSERHEENKDGIKIDGENVRQKLKYTTYQLIMGTTQTSQIKKPLYKNPQK